MVIREPTRAKLDIAQQSSTSDICSDCSQIIELFTDMISNTDTQEWINNTLDDLCLRLPSGVAQSHCISQVQMYLPQALQYLIGILKPGETCMVLGLCAVHSKRGAPTQFSPTNTDMDLSNAVLDSGTNPEVQVSPQCTFYIYLMKKLESILPTEKIEDAVVKLMGGVCGLLPASYKDQCNDFINKYGKKIVNFLLPSAAPYSICALLHLCMFQETPSMDLLFPPVCLPEAPQHHPQGLPLHVNLVYEKSSSLHKLSPLPVPGVGLNIAIYAVVTVKDRITKSIQLCEKQIKSNVICHIVKCSPNSMAPEGSGKPNGCM
ncbi:prosaposin-like [Salmo trutta]|uniref:prosaposin-like n=1 Tax=Salmo trutta TaxID=8032 RepID=UPI0011308E5E|nr:prosaposin-like [Salmo trutta]